MEQERVPRPEVWKLNVQGIVIQSAQPVIVVRDALKLAGFDPEAGWIIVLKVAGEKRKEVDLTARIDLTHTGIEKLRLTPRQINNGEVVTSRRREFALLAKDEAHLERLGIVWETVLDGGRRWLILPAYLLPVGYTETIVDVAIEVPSAYPGAQLDMFYCHPPLALTSGKPIPQTQHTETVLGRTFQRWSRHRGWDCAKDSLATHLALVDESLSREIEP